MLDDHEVVDNWEPLPSDAPGRAESEQRLVEGSRLYRAQQRALWPDPPTPDGAPLYESRRIHGLDFFFADTRTERDHRWIGNLGAAHLVSSGQQASMRDWFVRLAETQRATRSGTPGFVVSASILLPRPLPLKDRPALALHVDSWCGYPNSFAQVLADLFDSGARNVLFLSGDEHLSCIATALLTCAGHERTVRFHSVHSSALYAPYPFANSRCEDFAADDTFSFDHVDERGTIRQFTCRVTTYFPNTGDGFALLRPHFDANSGRWVVDVEFDGAAGRASHQLMLQK